jgi:hypothetical protein
MDGEQFARAHDLEVGFLLNFKYEGSGRFRVKMFDPMM